MAGQPTQGCIDRVGKASSGAGCLGGGAEGRMVLDPCTQPTARVGAFAVLLYFDGGRSPSAPPGGCGLCWQVTLFFCCSILLGAGFEPMGGGMEEAALIGGCLVPGGETLPSRMGMLRAGESSGQTRQREGCVVQDGAALAGLPRARGGGGGDAGAGIPSWKALGLCPELNAPLLLTQPLPEAC